jgi:RNA polymerase sigma-70 factor, ECF subfamily
MIGSDRDYVAQCLDSHPEAFRHLVGRYQGVVMSYLAGRVGTLAGAEEAAQETFVRAYFSLDKLKKPEAFFSWILGIADRVAREQQRLEIRDRTAAKLWSQNRPEPELTPNLALEKAVGGLEDPYRQIVLLRYYGNLSCVQVSERLEMPLGTVTKYLSRAYAMLRETLNREVQA